MQGFWLFSTTRTLRLVPQRLASETRQSICWGVSRRFAKSVSQPKAAAPSNTTSCFPPTDGLFQENAARPMIFIAHSMGGIIVKEALATAWREHRVYPMIWVFTYAIFFLAVPHKGSDHASWGQMVADVYSTVTIQPNNCLLESLRRTSGDNEELNARFEPLHKAYKFYSWVESLPCQGLGVVRFFLWPVVFGASANS